MKKVCIWLRILRLNAVLIGYIEYTVGRWL